MQLSLALKLTSIKKNIKKNCSARLVYSTLYDIRRYVAYLSFFFSEMKEIEVSIHTIDIIKCLVYIDSTLWAHWCNVITVATKSCSTKVKLPILLAKSTKNCVGNFQTKGQKVPKLEDLVCFSHILEGAHFFATCPF